MEHLEGLNQRQQEAVCHFEGPLLILAGAGSGKTRVLTNRAAWLIDEKGVNPWNILAITFTNKAADEMRSRVERIVGPDGKDVWVATFHSTCARILRRHIDRLGYDRSYTIYDAEDQRTLMKGILTQMGIDTKGNLERAYLGVISSAKDELIGPEEYASQTEEDDTHMKQAAEVYQEYQRQLKQNNALDFDDLIMKTVELFRECPDVLSSYQGRFRFIMVDEYQDTNTAQFQFVNLLAQKYRNLCVVGDDDQSIYKFRGANIQNILSFEKYFPETKVIRLEQNYRSTQNILDVANAVIANNVNRKEKRLWTENGRGDPVRYVQLKNSFEEAEYVAANIGRQVRREQAIYGDYAVLYRTNAQSRAFEEAFMKYGVPYQIIGGINFYSRKEIKDLLAYLKTVDNARDDLAVKRIINVPRRGIGAATVKKIEQYAFENGLSFYEGLQEVRIVPGLSRSAAGKVEGFVRLIGTLRDKQGMLSVKELLKEILDQTGYRRELEEQETEEAQERVENIDELINKAESYVKSAEMPSLSGFLEEVALVADIDTMEDSDSRVTMLTMHAAKGLEFSCVYLTGMEDGLFPSYLSLISSDADSVEEERRLCYVGMTRAKFELTLTSARERMVRGETRGTIESRFLDEIPPELLDIEEWESGPVRGRRNWNRDAGGRKERFVSNFSINGEELDHDGFDEGRSSLEEERTGYEPEKKRSSSQPKETNRGAVLTPRQFEVKQADALGYEVGDTVRHGKFGVGIVTQIVEGGRDYEVTVEFEKYGVKKMFAAFAKMVKV